MTATNNVNASRWLVWAGVVTRRFAAPSRYRRGLRLEQLRRRTSVVTRRMAWTPTIAVNVSLSRADTWVTERGEREALTLGSPWHARPDTDGPVRTSPTAGWALPAAVATANAWPGEHIRLQTRRLIAEQVARALVRRVSARTDRVETRQAGRDLVLAAPAATAARPRALAEPELEPTPMMARLSSSPWSGREPVPPPLNVDRIADHVLDQLDRRVTAWRERVGRA